MKPSTFNTAMYLRLSRDDKDVDGQMKFESNSISSQREMIKNYIQTQEEMSLYDSYVDDGYTGSNFERPEFIRMIKDIKDGKVNCIVVKDLSRFGRDYIEAGRYIQKDFPAWGVRFIALTDGYDSFKAISNESNIILPVKNFINDSYCRDISIKVKSHLEMKRKNGEFTGAFAVYGYRKNPENKSQLIVDPYAAAVVKTIFEWKIQGMTAFAVAKQLNRLGILSPMSYKKSLGMAYHSGFTASGDTKWSSLAVKRILTNQVYLGHMIQGKKEKVSYKVKKVVNKAESQWLKVTHTHEPIITEDEFEVVQNLLKSDSRISVSTQQVSFLSNLIYCGDCKNQMVRRTSPYGKSHQVYYICSTKNRGEGCTRHSIKEEKVIEIISAALKSMVNSYLDQEKMMRSVSTPYIQLRTDLRYDQECVRLKKEQEKYTQLCKSLQEDLENKVVTKSEFERLYKLYAHKVQEVTEALKYQNECAESLVKNKEISKTQLKTFQENLRVEEIDRKMLVSLVRKIEIYEDNKIEIVFNFINPFEVFFK